MPSKSTNTNSGKVSPNKRYDFDALCSANPKLKKFVEPNIVGEQSIDFSNPKAVLALNSAILKMEYGIINWSTPLGYLCPPIPSRAAYIDLLANLLAEINDGKIPTGPNINCLDIGVGANCVYPFIGNGKYQWHFVGSDIDPFSINWASNLIKSNPHLQDKIDLRLQSNENHVFKGLINNHERYDLCICNPPFHASQADAIAANARKTINLGTKRIGKSKLNFGGTSGELWCPGGEKAFISNMIEESTLVGMQFLWFSTLVSKSANLKPLMTQLQKVDAKQIRQLDLVIGNKISRVLAWTYQNPNQMKSWVIKRWQNAE